ncbi:hypothetical protein [Mesorhizobium sp. L2C066B000]|uniref:hypothetical protein n=1 Tax=Mesorhizobium sp. L2C066B000 TaxID=1287105 RepID=UPI0003D0101F|nr:hypothetical protein [Mesorhizobium sp. L2C066B000]ESZ40072.1 hypothetical protein X732_11740 [Mesorhizobium sp. L2C066B000]
MIWLGTAFSLGLPAILKALGALWRFAMTPLGRVILLALLVAVLVAGSYLYGRRDGRAALAAELAGDRITILKDGKAIDNEVLAADDPALCALLGGCLQPDAD